MSEINLKSLTLFVLICFVGAICHWGKKKRRGEIQGTLYDYLVADKPGNTTMMASAVLGASITAANTGALNGLDLAAAWTYLKNGALHMPTLHVMISAFTFGWMADSSLNKGGG